MAGRREAEDAMASRFEILEEETHYPAKPATEDTSKAAAAASDEAVEAEKEEETLEAQLAKLMLVDGETSVKNASSAKELGNKLFSEGQYLDAIECYTTALKLCPAEDEYAYNRAVYFSNRAACLNKINRTEEAIDDCTQAIELSPTYVKALLRRAEMYEKIDKLDEALKDYDAVLKIDPTIKTAVKAHERVKKVVDERTEKMKAEMLDKLKGFGNTILGKFGLSTDNFQMVQDPNTGSYNINFVQNTPPPGSQ
ncbi:hypothetical protein Poli38472_002715 [Pythium oligandrum]|uniref:Tetratricopeptide repeat protein 1 n=1 Tax=Pythium oligandrum TaxID=41045 RepID=A0A8K1CHP2_PYTOL|nr:hypothetical protein Poli38472_002715 [Pythium oligandrum]|eukprot:TMW63774.1 hypothetical protein Poli38472_002715 [Pythium oligandrum]